MPVRVDLNASSHADTDQESLVQRIRRALGAIAARKPAVFWLKSTRHILFGATSPSSARHEGIKNSGTWALRGSELEPDVMGRERFKHSFHGGETLQSNAAAKRTLDAGIKTLIAANLTRLRKRRGLSRRHLARIAKVNRSTIEAVELSSELDKVELNPDAIERLKHAVKLAARHPRCTA
jgi:DNA-binding XRE family transcriptional regulator